MQTTFESDLAVLTELVAVGGNLDAAKVHLATAGPVLNPNMTVSDWTEAASTGFAAKSITWGTPYTGGDGTPQVDTQLLSFIATAVASPETIVGYYVTDTAGTALLFADFFADPFPVTVPGQGISFAIGYRRYDGVLSVL